MTTRDCCFCGQIHGRAEGDLIARLLPGEVYARRILLETDSFAVLPDLAGLTRGHALLCPKAHVRGFAGLDAGLADELAALKRRLRSTLSAIYGQDITVFEHGMASAGGRIVCTVDHAHLHFVPLPSALDRGVEAIRDWPRYDGSLSTLRDIVGGREYATYETPRGEHHVFVAADGPLESQYLRRVIAEALGRAERWNWRDAPDPRGADATWREFVAQ